ncbi:MAPEG family protein [Ottowia testudinis]|uniref:MAPEG family protein n=1 Tax=Ottowia testudinis TaxID=2816950 RepID=A0A975CFD4_9BURK|nr:MAPEG family protein [Ottowia testudinis]QTD44529.1 MAPEG family protein [Ottowia testudinis]
MLNPETFLALACIALMLLTFGVGLLMLRRRVQQMRAGRIRPQSLALSAARAALLKDSRASDNYNHLFELPVIFYALCTLALALRWVPVWLPWCAWLFVALRVAHSAVQVSHNRVMQRFRLFMAGFATLGVMCVGYAVALLMR